MSKWISAALALIASAFVFVALFTSQWWTYSLEDPDDGSKRTIRWGVTAMQECASGGEQPGCQRETYSKQVDGLRGTAYELLSGEAKKAVQEIKNRRTYGLVLMVLGLIGGVLFLVGGGVTIAQVRFPRASLQRVATIVTVVIAALLLLSSILFITTVASSAPRSMAGHMKEVSGVGYSFILMVLGAVLALAAGFLAKRRPLADEEFLDDSYGALAGDDDTL